METITLLYKEQPLLGLIATVAPIVAYNYNPLYGAIALVILLILVFMYRYTPINRIGRLHVDDDTLVCPANGIIDQIVQTDGQTLISIFLTSLNAHTVVYPGNCRVLFQGKNLALPTQYSSSISLIDKKGYNNQMNSMPQYMLNGGENQLPEDVDNWDDLASLQYKASLTMQEKNNLVNADNIQTADAIGSKSLNAYLSNPNSKQVSQNQVTHILQLGNNAQIHVNQLGKILSFNKRSTAYAGELMGVIQPSGYVTIMIPKATSSKYKTPDYKQFYLNAELKVGDKVSPKVFLGRYY